MAKSKKFKYGKNYKKKRYNRKARTNEVKRFAYNMGLVERGLKNPDSLISSCYKRGQVERQKADYKKKTLF